MKRFILSLCLVSALGTLTGCDDKAPQPSSNTNTNGQGGGIIIGTAVGTVGSTESQLYVQMLGKAEGSVTNASAIAIGSGEQFPFVFKNHLYSFPSYTGTTKSEIKQYEIQESAIVKKASISVPAGMYVSIFESPNSDKGYIISYGSNKLIEFTPSTFTLTGKEIDLNSLAQEGVSTRPSLIIERDGLLFVGLNQIGDNYMPKNKQAEMAVINASDGSLVKKIVDTKHELSFATRPINAGSLFMDESGDIYVGCMGGFSILPDFYGGYLRIKKGATDFDPDWAISFKELTVEGLEGTKAGDISFPTATQYIGNDKLVAYVAVNTIDAQQENVYVRVNNVPILIDLKTRTAKLIKGISPSDQIGLALGMHQGKLIIGNNNKQLSGFYAYDPETEQVTGPIITTVGAPAFFWSRTPNK